MTDSLIDCPTRSLEARAPQAGEVGYLKLGVILVEQGLPELGRVLELIRD